jgi:methylenetetrahydrofolate dehydrogenase (NADP+)/methenyltetrahydrofolate cyclohydrolase
LIDPEKDVDGLTIFNQGRLVKGQQGLFPATAEAVINMLRYYQIPLEGKKVLVIGRSNLVGKPLAEMLIRENATVTVTHSKTPKNVLDSYSKAADIIVSAVGKAGLITAEMVKKGAVVIDVGTNSVNGHFCGDVNFEAVSKKASFITPVPKGVGPMTVAMLLSNVVKAYYLNGGGKYGSRDKGGD